MSAFSEMPSQYSTIRTKPLGEGKKNEQEKRRPLLTCDNQRNTEQFCLDCRWNTSSYKYTGSFLAIKNIQAQHEASHHLSKHNGRLDPTLATTKGTKKAFAQTSDARSTQKLWNLQAIVSYCYLQCFNGFQAPSFQSLKTTKKIWDLKCHLNL